MNNYNCHLVITTNNHNETLIASLREQLASKDDQITALNIQKENLIRALSKKNKIIKTLSSKIDEMEKKQASAEQLKKQDDDMKQQLKKQEAIIEKMRISRKKAKMDHQAKVKELREEMAEMMKTAREDCRIYDNSSEYGSCSTSSVCASDATRKSSSGASMEMNQPDESGLAAELEETKKQNVFLEKMLNMQIDWFEIYLYENGAAISKYYLGAKKDQAEYSKRVRQLKMHIREIEEEQLRKEKDWKRIHEQQKMELENLKTRVKDVEFLDSLFLEYDSFN